MMARSMARISGVASRETHLPCLAAVWGATYTLKVSNARVGCPVTNVYLWCTCKSAWRSATLDSAHPYGDPNGDQVP